MSTEVDPKTLAKAINPTSKEGMKAWTKIWATVIGGALLASGAMLFNWLRNRSVIKSAKSFVSKKSPFGSGGSIK